jgi:hypothetical protein
VPNTPPDETKNPRGIEEPLRGKIKSASPLVNQKNNQKKQSKLLSDLSDHERSQSRGITRELPPKQKKNIKTKEKAHAPLKDPVNKRKR